MARVLIAEDDPHISRVIALWLKRCGHEVAIAASGDEALAMIRQRAPDLLVTDINMPAIDGLQLLETVRAESLIALLQCAGRVSRLLTGLLNVYVKSIHVLFLWRIIMCTQFFRTNQERNY